MYSFLKDKFGRESVGSMLRRLHSDEGGAEGLEKLLIIAAVILPLLGLLMWYKDDISKWINGFWSNRQEQSQVGGKGDFSPDLPPTPQ